MCGTCGCGITDAKTALDLQSGETALLEGHSHVHAYEDGTRYVHSHGSREHHHPHDEHDHDEHPHAREVVDIEARVLAKNDALAAQNRAWLEGLGVAAVNLMSAPGAGKTTLLERTIRDTKGVRPLLVLEGDQATANDGQRIRAAGAPVIQLNTGTGCHLDADMVAHGLRQLELSAGSLVVIENVGNLVCPALFDVGERRRVVVLSVTEGDDKPLKYPHMFRTADLVLINKVDLLPYVDFDPARAAEHARAMNADVTIILTSARTGEGMADWYASLDALAAPPGGIRGAEGGGSG